jgi:hypothetical protein
MPDQFTEENDLGRGGGEVDDEKLREAWQRRERQSGYDDPVRESEELTEEIERRA